MTKKVIIWVSHRDSSVNYFQVVKVQILAVVNRSRLFCWLLVLVFFFLFYKKKAQKFTDCLAKVEKKKRLVFFTNFLGFNIVVKSCTSQTVVKLSLLELWDSSITQKVTND
jgi:hypothetical protein